MTEAEWDSCTEPQPLLELLRGRASARKLRLFAIACCRRVEHLLIDAMAREALAVAARFADGLVSDADRSAARKAAQRAAQGRGVTRHPDAPKWQRRAASAVYYAAAREAMEAAWNAPQLAVESLLWRAGGYTAGDVRAVRVAEQAGQAIALRDVFGNPFRLVGGGAGWRTPAVAALAACLYEDGRFEDLPILADALEEAGCTEESLLSHLRGAGPHAQGCWAVDRILGKR